MKHASPLSESSISAIDVDKKPKHGKHAAHAASSDAGETKKLDPVDSAPAAEQTRVLPSMAAAAAKVSSGAGETQAIPPAGSAADEDETELFASVAPVVPESAGQQGGFDMPETDGSGRHRARKIVAIVLGAIVLVLAAAYFAGLFFFSSHFFPNTTIGEDDVSLASTAEVEAKVSETASDYSLHVIGWGFDLTLDSAQIGLNMDSGAVANAMIDSLNPWAWPVEVFRSRDVSENMVGVYDGTGLNDTVRKAIEEHNATSEPSKNATIGYSEAEGRIVVIPEVHGTQLNVDAVVEAVDEAVTTLQPELRLTDEHLVAPEITSDDERLAAAAEQANAMLGVDMGLTMGGTEVARVNGELVASWITLGEDFAVKLDDGLISGWVDEFVAGHNTVGTERTYTRPDGKVITIAGGVYGWGIDRDSLIETVRTGVSECRTESVEVPCWSSAAAWNGLGVQDWGSRYIDIDLSEQHVYFYDGGTLVWDSPCISGKPSYDGRYNTSTGVFTINTMASPSKLIGYENGQKIYETEVTFWMPFDGNVIGLHDADWQPWGAFYPGMYADGYGSHGCVNLPPGNAASLYSMIYSGDVVICHW